MNIKPGTRVRNIEEGFPKPATGTYTGRKDEWYMVDWDGFLDSSPHFAHEFEVIS